MARDLNKITISGRLGKDVELKVIQSGSAVAKFTVASGRSFKQPDGNYKEQTEWFNVVAWEKLAETCANFLKKGSHVIIEGRVQTRDWLDEQGQKRYMTEVIASDMYMLDKRQDGGGGNNNSEVDDSWDNAEPASTFSNNRGNSGNTNSSGGNTRSSGNSGNANAGSGNANPRPNASGNTNTRNTPSRPASRYQADEVEPEDIPF